MNKKFLVIAPFLLLILIIVITVYQTFSYKQETHKGREFSFHEILTEKAFYIEKQIVPIFTTIDTIISNLNGSLNPTKSNNKKLVISQLIKLQNMDFIDKAFILDSSGICIYSSETSLHKTDYSTTINISKIIKNDNFISTAKDIRTKEYSIFYSKALRHSNLLLGTFVIKLNPKVFSTEMKWENILPSDLKNEVYNGVLTPDNIFFSLNFNKLYHLSSISPTFAENLNKSKNYQNEEIVNLKLLKKSDTYSYLANHRIIHRKNFYQEEYLIFSNPILEGKLILIHIMPHNVFMQFFDNKSNIIDNIFKLLSAPIILIFLLLLTLIISTISYKRNISDLISTSNLKAAEAAVQGIEKDEFLATVTHELRTPLNGVMGITTILRDTPLDDMQIEYLNMIDSCSTSLLKTINDVLDISKIRSGVLTLVKKPFNLPVLIHNISTPIEQDAHKKDLSFFIDIPENLPEWLTGDSERIKQILDNFLTNAIKFTDLGSIRFSIEILNNIEKNCTLQFIISDTGIGISQEDQERMFETFIQAEMSTTRLYGGMGLGLSIAKSLSDLMNGDITLKSILGKGSDFSFQITLPLANYDNI